MNSLPVRHDDELFVETVMYRDIERRVLFAIQLGEHILFKGDAGCGKTAAIRFLARRLPNTILVELSSVHASAAKLYGLLCEHFHLCPFDKTQVYLRTAFINKLRNLASEPYIRGSFNLMPPPRPILILDEANVLEARALKDIQDVCTETGAVLVAVGNVEMLTSSRATKISAWDLKQIDRRFGQVRVIPKPTHGDVMAIADALCTLDEQQKTRDALINYASNTSVGHMVSLVKMAARLCPTDAIGYLQITEAIAFKHSLPNGSTGRLLAKAKSENRFPVLEKQKLLAG